EEHERCLRTLSRSTLVSSHGESVVVTKKALQPLGDQAVLASFADETAALRFALSVRRQQLAWAQDVVLAYTTVAVFFDLDHINYAAAAGDLQKVDLPQVIPLPEETRLHSIPCCYEYQLDLARVAESTGL